MGVRADSLKPDDVIWALDYSKEPKSGSVIAVKDDNIAIIETAYNKNLAIWDAWQCYSTEEQALVSAASGLQYDATQSMQKAQRMFERLNEIREKAIQDK